MTKVRRRLLSSSPPSPGTMSSNAARIFSPLLAGWLYGVNWRWPYVYGTTCAAVAIGLFRGAKWYREHHSPEARKLREEAAAKRALVTRRDAALQRLFTELESGVTSRGLRIEDEDVEASVRLTLSEALERLAEAYDDRLEDADPMAWEMRPSSIQI